MIESIRKVLMKQKSLVLNGIFLKKYVLTAIFSVIFFSSLSCGSQQLANDELREVLSNATARIVVVNYFNQIISEGSGFLFDKRGYIATNFHVIAPGNGNGIF
jgi:S1-C subfamily serine protease